MWTPLTSFFGWNFVTYCQSLFKIAHYLYLTFRKNALWFFIFADTCCLEILTDTNSIILFAIVPVFICTDLRSFTVWVVTFIIFTLAINLSTWNGETFELDNFSNPNSLCFLLIELIGNKYTYYVHISSL